MTAPVVVDTNVILVANRVHPDASEECVVECVRRLQALMLQGVVVIDDAYLILHEYQKKPDLRHGKGVGVIFLKWLLQHSSNAKRVHRVPITELSPDHFSEFPVPALQPSFDPPDRKFVAVANAHRDKPPIWQAVDCKWLDWWSPLAAVGIHVEFLCPRDICGFYVRKFPKRPRPRLP